MIGTDHAAAIAGPHGIMVRYHGTARWTTIPGDDADLLIETVRRTGGAGAIDTVSIHAEGVTIDGTAGCVVLTVDHSHQWRASFVQDGTVRPLMAWTGHEPIALAQLITAGTN